MSVLRCRLWLTLLVLLAVSFRTSRAQAEHAHDWNAELIGKPLYLRGCWAADRLHFDGSGSLLGNDRRVGPLTLSGFDARKISVHDRQIVLEGPRVALVAGTHGAEEMERRPISSTTLIPFSLKPGARDFHAPEQLRIVIDADREGGFDEPLAKVFAIGLPQLALSLPAYWRCYGLRYFSEAGPNVDAEAGIKRCVTSGEVVETDDMTPPAIVASPAPRLTYVGDLEAQGEVKIHVRLSAEGTPTDLQIVRAVGAGVDEAVLLAVSHWTFRPAMRNGVGVPSHIEVAVAIDPPH